MSYNNPSILIPAQNIGLNEAIESIRLILANIGWLQKSFGRAWEFKEQLNDKVLTIPKVFQGRSDNTNEGEYLNVLPNDNLDAYSFIFCTGPEKWDTFNRFDGSMKRREMSVIVWVNLKAIDNSKNYIFTDELKIDFEQALGRHPSVKSLNEYYDEIAEDIFKGWSINDVKTQYLMYPYAGMRFNFTMVYEEVCV